MPVSPTAYLIPRVLVGASDRVDLGFAEGFSPEVGCFVGEAVAILDQLSF